MQRYRNRLEVEAIQFTNTPENRVEIEEWFGEPIVTEQEDPDEDPVLIIDDYTTAELNDWITKVEGEDYEIYVDEDFNNIFEIIN